jgi:hypothetical protein
MTPHVLKLDSLTEDIRLLKWTVYGNEQAGEPGLVRSMKSIQTKLDTLIKLSEARENQWKGIKNAIVAVGAISSFPLIQAIGHLMGIWP